MTGMPWVTRMPWPRKTFGDEESFAEDRLAEEIGEEIAFPFLHNFLADSEKKKRQY